jgi:hypothetical protein
MADRFSLAMDNPKTAIEQMRLAWQWVRDGLGKPGGRIVAEFRTDTRSMAQNRIMWSCLSDLSRQVTWFGKRMTPDGWKHWITGHLNGQELHPNMDGTGFISVTKGASTSSMTIAEMTAVIDLCHAFGAEQYVQWSPKSLGKDETC